MQEQKKSNETPTANQIFQVFVSSQQITPLLVEKIQTLESSVQVEIFSELLRLISAFYSKNDSNFHFRTFDQLDALFGIQYELNEEKLNNSAEERLYLSAGAGVQTGYSNLLESISKMELQPGNEVVDLGSGYGRLGHLIAILFSDVSFKGYEFVEGRVRNGNKNMNRIGTSKRIEFIEQDLSRQDFAIPSADVYYMYDPFTSSTYDTVISKLIQNSKDKVFKIITKGGATEAVQLKLNLFPREFSQEKFDQGNLCLFSGLE